MLRRLLAPMLFFSLTACDKEIGDACQTIADCTTGTDRVCDTTQPGGYCTIFNCEPDGCPEEAACIGFRASLSGRSGCRGHAEAQRLQRTFCMRACSKDTDCRSDYVCIDFAEVEPEKNPWSAEVVDQRSVGVCVVPYTADTPDDHQNEICTAGGLMVEPENDGSLDGAPPIEGDGAPHPRDSGSDAAMPMDSAMPLVDAAAQDGAALADQ